MFLQQDSLQHRSGVSKVLIWLLACPCCAALRLLRCGRNHCLGMAIAQSITFKSPLNGAEPTHKSVEAQHEQTHY